MLLYAPVSSSNSASTKALPFTPQVGRGVPELVVEEAVELELTMDDEVLVGVGDGVLVDKLEELSVDTVEDGVEIEVELLDGVGEGVLTDELEELLDDTEGVGEGVFKDELVELCAELVEELLDDATAS